MPHRTRGRVPNPKSGRPRLSNPQISNARFSPNHLRWTVSRSQRTFVVRVAEPQSYSPHNHGSIFEQVITQLVNPRQPALVGMGEQPVERPDRFDLLVFPEAFAPLDTVLKVLRALAQLEGFGCIHVGLRSAIDLENHLISKAELCGLLADLRALPKVVAEDFVPFAGWLDRQPAGGRFNVGCVFTIDAEGQIRICLHPKVVRSQFEGKPLPEQTMEEGDLLSLVTLQPEDRRFFPVTIQPLICSDALNLLTDRGTRSPLEELHEAANEFSALPDHVDIVSLATCTPQKPDKTATGIRYREWHQDFRAAFERAAQDNGLPRHHFASFVLSNFRALHPSAPGGLSGVFEPIGMDNPMDDPRITLACYGHPKDTQANNRWSTPADGDPTQSWRVRAYIAALNPEVSDPDAAVTIFGFTLPSILRDNSPWKPRQAVRNCTVKVGRWSDPPSLEFSRTGDLT